MSEIECVNLLAFIQFTIAFDFGLYYLDDKHALTKIYRKYQMDLRASVQAILQRADETIKESLKSEDEECILKSAYLDKAYRRLKYLTDENQLNLEGCGFIGLYAGLYGFLCLFCIGIFGCQHDTIIKTYILVSSQIILFLELLISVYNFTQGDCKKYSRNTWANIKLIIFIILFAGGMTDSLLQEKSDTLCVACYIKCVKLFFQRTNTNRLEIADNDISISLFTVSR